MKFKTFFFTILILLISILSLILFFKVEPEEEAQLQTFIISSGSQGGNYYEAGSFIEKTLNNISPSRYKFKVIQSSGSIENMKRLKNRFTDFAIVQRDVFIDNFLGDGDKIKNVSIVAPLFQEKFLIYTHQNNHIPFDKFKELSENQYSNKLKIGVTSMDGISFKIFSQIAELLNFPLSNLDFIERNYNELTKDFLNNNLDFVLTLSLPIREIEESNASLVYFNDTDIGLLTNRLRFFSQANLSGESTYKTLGIWALFVGLNRSIEKIGDKEILEHLTLENESNRYISNRIRATFENFKSNPYLFDNYLRNLSTTPALSASINRNEQNFYLYLMPFVLSVIILAYLYKYFISKGKKLHTYLWLRYNHIFIGIFLIVIIYFLSIEYLIYCETTFFNSTAVKSRIMDLTRTDLHNWNLIRIFADNDNDIFPFSLSGKMITAFSTYVLFFGIFAIPLIEYGVSQLTAKRREGKMKIKHKKHVIISGWNTSTPTLVTKLLAATIQYQRKSIKIVCVVPNPSTILQEETDISNLEKERKITFVKGNIRNKVVAESCNLNLALAVILLAEDDTISADEKTLMSALSISKFSSIQQENTSATSKITDKNEKGIFQSRKDINSVYIIAEVNHEEFVEDLLNAGVNGIVNRGRIIEGILVQSLFNPGVSKLLNNILSISGDTNEFYTIDLRDKENKHLRNRTFDELLLPLRKEKILLIAIKIVYLNEIGEIIVDEDELARLLKEDGLERQIITNPINQGETSRRVDNNDQLIVLSINKIKLTAGLARVTF